MKDKFKFILFGLIGILILEIIGMAVWFNEGKQKMKKNYSHDLQVKLLTKEQEKKKILDEFEKSKYLASGNNVYDRIHNKQEQNIISLLSDLTTEAFPDGWEFSIEVEEFTNFLLLVQFVEHEDVPDIKEVSKYLIPIIKYGSPYLKNIAVYNNKRKCFLFFSEEHLKELVEKKELGELSIRDVKNNGRRFTQYNSVKIDFQEIEGHIILPATVTGADGVYECYMMLDTGASTSVISLELAQKTGREDLKNVPKRSFSTAKGLLTCFIITREISVSGIDVKKEVAVNIEDESNLLGVDFFKDYDYIIDSKSKCIYAWSK